MMANANAFMVNARGQTGTGRKTDIRDRNTREINVKTNCGRDKRNKHIQQRDIYQKKQTEEIQAEESMTPEGQTEERQ